MSCSRVGDDSLGRKLKMENSSVQFCTVSPLRTNSTRNIFCFLSSLSLPLTHSSLFLGGKVNVKLSGVLGVAHPKITKIDPRTQNHRVVFMSASSPLTYS